jgi:CubicO group peptidase (beta-lactamase class C family)
VRTTVLHDALDRLIRKHRVPGAQVAVRRCTDRGEDDLVVAVGEQEIGTGRPVTRDARFPIGSIGKMYTATLAMLLVADGDLDLDDPVTDHLPELTAGAVTLRHLLSHTSGLVDEPTFAEPDRVSRQGYVLDAWRIGPMFPPGAAFSYSNAGYVLVGHLVEKITGMSWWEAVQTLLLDPLGSTAAFVVGPARTVTGGYLPGHAVSPARSTAVPVRQAMTPAEAPVGALALSATDLVRYAALHLPAATGPSTGPPTGSSTGTVLDADTLTRMREPVPAADPLGFADGWACGLALYRHHGRTWYGHDGTGDGTSCHLRFDPTGGTAVALTTNCTTGAALWPDLVDELRTAGIDVGDHTGPTPPGPDAERPRPPGCEGRYRNGAKEYLVAADPADRTVLHVGGKAHSRLVFRDDLTFTTHDLRTGEQTLPGRFTRDPRSGRIDRVLVTGRLAVRDP